MFLVFVCVDSGVFRNISWQLTGVRVFCWRITVKDPSARDKTRALMTRSSARCCTDTTTKVNRLIWDKSFRWPSGEFCFWTFPVLRFTQKASVWVRSWHRFTTHIEHFICLCWFDFEMTENLSLCTQSLITMQLCLMTSRLLIWRSWGYVEVMWCEFHCGFCSENDCCRTGLIQCYTTESTLELNGITEVTQCAALNGLVKWITIKENKKTFFQQEHNVFYRQYMMCFLQVYDGVSSSFVVAGGHCGLGFFYI